MAQTGGIPPPPAASLWSNHLTLGFTGASPGTETAATPSTSPSPVRPHVALLFPSSQNLVSPRGCPVSTLKRGDANVGLCDVCGHLGFTVALQGPVGPVKEGSDVPLCCMSRSGPVPAQFYMQALLVGTSSEGHMTIRNFSKSDESAYTCRDSEGGESRPTWLLMEGELLPFCLNSFFGSPFQFCKQIMSQKWLF